MYLIDTEIMVFVIPFPKKLSILFFLYVYVCEMHVSEDMIMWMCLLSYTMFGHVLYVFYINYSYLRYLQFFTVNNSFLQFFTVNNSFLRCNVKNRFFTVKNPTLTGMYVNYANCQCHHFQSFRKKDRNLYFAIDNGCNKGTPLILRDFVTYVLDQDPSKSYIKCMLMNAVWKIAYSTWNTIHHTKCPINAFQLFLFPKKICNI